jgi:predicted nucleic acid-binding protein
VAGYVLDTSAVMAVILEEHGSDLVREAVYGQERVTLPFIVLMEVEYKLLQVRPEVVEESLSTLDAWPVHPAESFFTWRRAAAQVKAQGKISLADAWIASLALLEDAELIHKDPEFDAVTGLKHLRLPYDQQSTRGRSS